MQSSFCPNQSSNRHRRAWRATSRWAALLVLPAALLLPSHSNALSTASKAHNTGELWSEPVTVTPLGPASHAAQYPARAFADQGQVIALAADGDHPDEFLSWRVDQLSLLIEQSTVNPSGGTPQAALLHFADFTNDGAPDLLGIQALQPSQLRISVFPARSSALTQLRSAYSEGLASLPTRIFTAPRTTRLLFEGGQGEHGALRSEALDVNGDGSLDLLLARSGSSVLTALLGDGRGAFHTVQSITLAAPFRDWAIGEINQPDGITDVVVSVSNGARHYLQVFQSPHGAMLAPPETVSLTHPAHHLRLQLQSQRALVDVIFQTAGEPAARHPLVGRLVGRARHLTASTQRRTSVPRATITITEATTDATTDATNRFSERQAAAVSASLFL